MAKTKISEYSSTANSNTDIASINIDEGCAPSGINNAIRALMAQLKDFQTGAASDPVTVGGVLTVTGGSAAAPAITTSGDTNTGVLFPAADTVGITTGGTERVRVDSSGNVGIGTSSPATALEVKGSSPSINVNGTTSASFRGYSIRSNGTEIASMLAEASAGENRFTAGFSGFGGFQTFYTNGLERARIDSSGNLLVGTTSTVNPGGVTGTSSFKTASSSKWAGAFENSASSSPWGVGVTYTGAAPNGTSNAFFYGTDTGGDRFFMRSNGGLANYSANNANLSDERTKTDIQNAGGYLAKICAIPVRTFKYKDQTDDLLNLGVIAQEVEAVAPELVDVSGFGETPEDGVPLKAIYQTDLQYALMKCIQEQQAIITQLQADVAALKGQ